MISSHQQLDKRLSSLRAIAQTPRPSRGWVHAIRQALGMTTGQLARRMGVSQPRIVKLESAEAEGSITLESLERAAEALGCRVFYVLMPEKPLGETLRLRADEIATQRSASVDQTMRLEAQAVTDAKARAAIKKRLAEDLLRHPARLWDEG